MTTQSVKASWGVTFIADDCVVEVPQEPCCDKTCSECFTLDVDACECIPNPTCALPPLPNPSNTLSPTIFEDGVIPSPNFPPHSLCGTPVPWLITVNYPGWAGPQVTRRYSYRHPTFGNSFYTMTMPRDMALIKRANSNAVDEVITNGPSAGASSPSAISSTIPLTIVSEVLASQTSASSSCSSGGTFSFTRCVMAPPETTFWIESFAPTGAGDGWCKYQRTWRMRAWCGYFPYTVPTINVPNGVGWTYSGYGVPTFSAQRVASGTSCATLVQGPRCNNGLVEVTFTFTARHNPSIFFRRTIRVPALPSATVNVVTEKAFLGGIVYGVEVGGDIAYLNVPFSASLYYRITAGSPRFIMTCEQIVS